MDINNIINLDYLRKLSRGDEKFVEDVIELFLKNTPKAIANMRRYFNSKNWEDLMMEAHKIRPSFNFMGTRGLEEAAKRIENYASKQAEVELMDDLITEIEDSLESVFRQLEYELKNIDIQ